MATAPFHIVSNPVPRELPDYLPARMVNEFVYCPRLFFYEWVDGVFKESVDTIEGSAQHKRVDKPGKALPPPDDLDDQQIHTRSITLSSEGHRVIAKLDVLEVESNVVTPVDYKHGKPRESNDALEIWPADRVQLAVQAIILRENGHDCRDGVIYYQSTKQRVRVEFSEGVIAEAEAAVQSAWELARHGSIPPPLFGSPKCPGCSLAPVCLPDEVTQLRGTESQSEQLTLFAFGESAAPRKLPLSETRRLIAPRDDLRPVYLDTQGLRVGRSGSVLHVKDRDSKDRDSLVQEIRLNEICQLNLLGNIQVTTQAIQSLCEAEIPICYFSQGGWFYGITTGLSTKNVFLRQRQFAMAGHVWFSRNLASRLTAGKIRNQRTLLLRNHLEPPSRLLAEMKAMAERADNSSSMEELLGLEGNAARLYFSAFDGMIKVDDEDGRPGSGGFRFAFEGRNRRPPLDPVNALLSLGYSMLAKDLTIACYAVGFDPMMGFYHQPRFGRPSLALDLMEPFRPLIVDSAVINAINTRMISLSDFITVGKSVVLRPSGRKAFYRAYELRMDTLVTHPMFNYRVSYRRLLEIQARLLAKVLEGDIGQYPVFVTR
jgi:CRISP-associated protein Cas1